MDLRQLRTFVSVAELGSLSLAAARLNIAQSALSRQIMNLEADLGAALFTRHGRGMSLTDQGEILMARARVILLEVDAARAELGASGAEPAGEVAFGVPPSVAEVLSGHLIESFADAHRAVRLRLVSGYSGHVLDWLQRGAIDLGIIYESRSLPMIATEPLLREALFLIRPPGGVAGPATLAAVAAQRLVLPSPQHGLRQLLDAVAARQGLTLTAVAEADALPVQIDLVRRGMGATILPYLPVAADVAAGRLVATRIETPPITRTLVLATPLGRPPRPATRAFAVAIRAEVSRLIASREWPGVSDLQDMPDCDS